MQLRYPSSPPHKGQPLLSCLLALGQLWASIFCHFLVVPFPFSLTLSAVLFLFSLKIFHVQKTQPFLSSKPLFSAEL